MLHRRHHDEWWLQWWGQWINKLLESEIVKMTCSLLLSLRHPLSAALYKNHYGWQHPCSLTAVNRIAYKLVQVGSDMKVTFCFYFTQCPITSVPLPIINGTTHNNKNLSLFPSYIRYLNILLLSNFILLSCLLCPARAILLVFVFLLLYN